MVLDKETTNVSMCNSASREEIVYAQVAKYQVAIFFCLLNCCNKGIAVAAWRK